ncbi:hypothetical protein [uncultured Tateyamaria sp.]|uniref:hypothetical protein n=1 Tax=uncultured Tateyamaria sp. TaxID=455651 RepID=UPI002627B8B5|nr:hypothetical protein [uncultured Tateyamaria sp.]
MAVGIATPLLTCLLAILLIRQVKWAHARNLVSLIYTPTTLTLLIALVLPIYWNLTLGPLTGSSDDGRGMGGAFALIVAFPLTLVLNLVVYFKSASQNDTESEVPQ